MPAALTSNLPEVLADLVRLQQRVDTMRQDVFLPVVKAIARQTRETYATHTPIGPGDGTHLRDEYVTDPVNTGGDPVIITTRNLKTVPTRDGENIPLYWLLTHDHKAYDIYPVNKKALFWDGAEHPVWGDAEERLGGVHRKAWTHQAFGEEAAAESVAMANSLFVAQELEMAASILEVIA